MGTSPTRVDTPRTGLEDQISQIFGNALNQASAPRPTSPGKGSPPAAGGMRAAGTMANLGGNPLNNQSPGGISLSNPGQGPSNPWGFTDPFGGGGGSGGTPGAGYPTGGQPGGGALGGGGMTRQPTIQEIFEGLSLPTYGGQLTAGSNPLLGGAFGAAQGSLDALPGYGQLSDMVTRGFQGFGSAAIAPDAVMSLLTNRPGAGVLGQLAGGGGAAGELLSLGRGGGAVGQLLAQGGQSDRDFGGIISALDAARRGSLEDSLRDTQERFSSSGLRFSTDLANALGETSRRSEEGFLGQAAQLLPQLTQQRQNALAQAGGLQLGAFQGAGGLGLGAGQALQQGGLAAGDILGQLYQGQQGRALQALSAIPGAQDILGRLGLDTTRQAFGIGQAQRGMEQEGLTAAYNEFLRTQGGLLAPILNFAAGAPQITGPGKGTQLMGLLS